MRRWAPIVLLCLAMPMGAMGLSSDGAEPQGTNAAGAGLETGAGRAKASWVDAYAAGLMRDWLAGRASRDAPLAKLHPAMRENLDPWKRYGEALEIAEPDERERALRRLHGDADDPLLQGVVLRAIAEDPACQSRQARFIRQYGFYANWLNRFFYTGVQTLQGNSRALVQLGVDGVYALFLPRGADPLDRKIYELERQAEAESRRGGGDSAGLTRLRRKLDRATAEADRARAQWELEAGNPEIGEFYARAAASVEPDESAAERLIERADSDIARRRRGQVASAQAGYPDRTPPIQGCAAEALRAILEDRAPEPGDLLARERGVAAILASLPPPDGGRAAMMRGWTPALRDRAAFTDQERRWLAAATRDPALNADERLDQARSRRRGQLWHYVVLGPARPSERIYQAATWVTNTLDALQNVGIFYVFEVAGRAGKALVRPPVPDEEWLDAQAAWLNDAPNPTNKEARRVANALADRYASDGRFDDVRRVVERSGQATDKKRKAIDRDEAKHWLATARTTPAGAAREAMLARVDALTSGTSLARAAEKLRKKRPEEETAREWGVDWTTLQKESGTPLPCGLPGRREWFDGKPVNGEITQAGVIFEWPRGGGKPLARYPVLFPDGVRIHEAPVDETQLSPALRRWLTFAQAQRKQAATTAERLDRLPIPFELKGGVGLSGIDFQPRLLPIESKPGEMELYR